MADIAIFGGGGLGKETKFLIEAINKVQHKWNFIGFFDDNFESGLGGIDDVNNYPDKLGLIVAIADSKIRSKIVALIHNSNIYHPSLIHPSAQINHQQNSIGEGSLICANVVMTCDIMIGNHSIINLSCTIGHDVIMGDYVSIMPGSNLSGNLNIGNKVFIGSGTQILQNIRIEGETVIGAGSVVINNLDTSGTYVGVPAKMIKK